MKNSILFIALIINSLNLFSQSFTSKDTLRFSADSSYSRALTLHKKNLIIGTSKTGVIQLNPKNGKTKTLIPPVPFGEFRDVVVLNKTVFACVSGDTGAVFSLRHSRLNQIYYKEGCFVDDLVLQEDKLIVLSDPVSDELSIFEIDTKTNETNTILEYPVRPEEAFYAASGTTGQVLSDQSYCFVSGGPNNATFYKLGVSEFIETNLPMKHGAGAGPFSLMMLDLKNGVIVGGDYTKPKEADATSLYTRDGGITWSVSTICTNGYRSCVTGRKDLLFACGTNGIDYSTDLGVTWKVFDSGNFCAMVLDGKTLYATSNKGYLIRYKL